MKRETCLWYHLSEELKEIDTIYLHPWNGVMSGKNVMKPDFFFLMFLTEPQASEVGVVDFVSLRKIEMDITCRRVRKIKVPAS